MPNSVVITKANCVNLNNGNNTFVYNFPHPVRFEKGEQVALESVSINYSWENVNSDVHNNNSFQYDWIVGGATTTNTVTIPNGLWELEDINAYLQYLFILRGQYLVNASGQNVFYAEFVVNSNQHAFQLNTYPVPTSLPSGFTAPSADTATGAVAWLGYPSTTYNPNVKMVSGNNFYQLIGFSSTFESGTNSGNGTNLSFLSTSPPEIHPNQNIFIALQNIDNPYANPTSIIHNLVADGAFGTQVVDRPSEFAYQKLTRGQYSSLRLQILGSDLKPLKIEDPDTVIVLLIKGQGNI